MRSILGWISLVCSLAWAWSDLPHREVMGMTSLILAFVIFGTDDILKAIKEARK